MLLPITARIVTDSNAMLPAELAARFGILEVSRTIVIDGRDRPEHAPGAAEALERSLRALPIVAETIGYLVGPSVAAHTGAGTFGAVFHAT
jgi:fatty acid-binding protein DegV